MKGQPFGNEYIRKLLAYTILNNTVKRQTNRITGIIESFQYCQIK